MLSLLRPEMPQGHKLSLMGVSQVDQRCRHDYAYHF